MAVGAGGWRRGRQEASRGRGAVLLKGPPLRTCLCQAPNNNDFTMSQTVPLTWGPEVHSNYIFYVFLQIGNLELAFFSNFRELKSKPGKAL